MEDVRCLVYSSTRGPQRWFLCHGFPDCWVSKIYLCEGVPLITRWVTTLSGMQRDITFSDWLSCTWNPSTKYYSLMENPKSRVEEKCFTKILGWVWRSKVRQDQFFFFFKLLGCSHWYHRYLRLSSYSVILTLVEGRYIVYFPALHRYPFEHKDILDEPCDILTVMPLFSFHVSLAC